MATVTLKGNSFNTVGELPKTDTPAPDFNLVKGDLSTVSLSDFSGKKLILNIFPSIDTGTCAASVRAFNKSVGIKQYGSIMYFQRFTFCSESFLRS